MTSSLQHAIATIKSGDRKRGQQLLAHTLLTNPDNEQAWIWMSGIIDSNEHRRYCMERVLAINPTNITAQRGLSELLKRWGASLTLRQGKVHLGQKHLDKECLILNQDQVILQRDQQILAESQATVHAEQEQLALQSQQLLVVTQTLAAQQASLQASHHDLDTAKTDLALALDTFTQAQLALEQRTQVLAEREQRANAEDERLKTWSDQLTKREDSVWEREWSVWQQQFVDPQHTALTPPILKNGVYSLSMHLDQLFLEQTLDLYKQGCNTQLWKDIDIERNKQAITGGGQADFCQPYKTLPPEDRVLIYCYANMRMHFYSSYHIFNTHRRLLHTHILDGHQRVLFVDIGCGPFTSGLAFNAFTHSLPHKPHLTYIGVDRAPAMLAKAEQFNQHGDYVDIFDKCEDYNELPNVIRAHVDDQEQLAIIFNMSYLFASTSLNIREFTAMVHDLTEVYKHCPICIVYQDPIDHKIATPNWNTFSDSFDHFNYLADAVEETIKYRLSSECKVSLKYNILTNQPCGTKRKIHATTQSARHSAGRIPALPARRTT